MDTVFIMILPSFKVCMGVVVQLLGKHTSDTTTLLVYRHDLNDLKQSFFLLLFPRHVI